MKSTYVEMPGVGRGPAPNEDEQNERSGLPVPTESDSGMF